jgi:UrcA family protein
MTIFTRKNSLRMLVLASITLATAAQAGTTATRVGAAYGDTQSTTVRYKDTDLRDAQGVQRLYARLDAAARTVCGTAQARVLTQMADWQRCRNAALDGAVAEINDARLSQLHSGKANPRKLVAEEGEVSTSVISGS